MPAPQFSQPPTPPGRVTTTTSPSEHQSTAHVDLAVDLTWITNLIQGAFGGACALGGNSIDY